MVCLLRAELTTSKDHYCNIESNLWSTTYNLVFEELFSTPIASSIADTAKVTLIASDISTLYGKESYDESFYSVIATALVGEGFKSFSVRSTLQLTAELIASDFYKKHKLAARVAQLVGFGASELALKSRCEENVMDVATLIGKNLGCLTRL
jgi:hypothetical protein